LDVETAFSTIEQRVKKSIHNKDNKVRKKERIDERERGKEMIKGKGKCKGRKGGNEGRRNTQDKRK